MVVRVRPVGSFVHLLDIASQLHQRFHPLCGTRRVCIRSAWPSRMYGCVIVSLTRGSKGLGCTQRLLSALALTTSHGELVDEAQTFRRCGNGPGLLPSRVHSPTTHATEAQQAAFHSRTNIGGRLQTAHCACAVCTHCSTYSTACQGRRRWIALLLAWQLHLRTAVDHGQRAQNVAAM